MTLSTRAINYLKSLNRDDKWIVDKEEMVEHFKRQNIPLNEKLIDIQDKYSGYELTIKNKSGSTFMLCFFSRQDIIGKAKIDFQKIETGFLFDFGQHKTAQFRFYITNLGELCVWGDDDDECPNIVCSSVEKFIEQYALKNELANQSENEYYHNVLDNEQLNKIFNQDFNIIDECSDRYSQWCTNGRLTLVKGTWLDKPEFYLHVYGTDKSICNSFVDKLEQDKIIQ